MMTTINRDQAKALAALVHQLRPEWDVAGVVKALSDARTRGDAWDVVHAALYAAANPKAETPAIIPMAGEHWLRGKELGQTTSSTTGRYARCDQEGHEHESAHACRVCRSEQLEADAQARHQAPRTPRVPRERVRAILAGVQTPAYRE